MKKKILSIILILVLVLQSIAGFGLSETSVPNKSNVNAETLAPLSIFAKDGWVRHNLIQTRLLPVLMKNESNNLSEEPTKNIIKAKPGRHILRARSRVKPNLYRQDRYRVLRASYHILVSKIVRSRAIVLSVFLACMLSAGCGATPQLFPISLISASVAFVVVGYFFASSFMLKYQALGVEQMNHGQDVGIEEFPGFVRPFRREVMANNFGEEPMIDLSPDDLILMPEHKDVVSNQKVNKTGALAEEARIKAIAEMIIESGYEYEYVKGYVEGMYYSTDLDSVLFYESIEVRYRVLKRIAERTQREQAGTIDEDPFKGDERMEPLPSVIVVGDEDMTAIYPYPFYLDSSC